MKDKLFYFVFFILFFSGCLGKKNIVPRDILQQQEIIAKFGDLPDTPFQVRLQKIAVSPENHSQVQLFYTSSMPQKDLMIFYQQQMERLGWHFLAESNIQDCLLCYSKPEQFCYIMMTEHRLSIYMCQKKDA